MSNRVTMWRARLQSPAAKPWLRTVRWAFTAGVVGWMLLKVRAIGWQEVADALPTTPWFYLLFVAMFLALPVTETAVFRLLLGDVRLSDLPVFIRKRVLNSALVGYSGEVYLFLWAEHRLGKSSRQVLVAIKDNAVLSATASALVTATLLALFVATGQTRLLDRTLDPGIGTVMAVVIGAVLLVPLLLRFRGTILAAPARVAGAVLGIHISRNVAVVLLQATQWAVVLPFEPWTVWLTYLTLQMVISRLPIVPNRDLLFLAVGLELSHSVSGPREGMAGLLLASGALNQAANLLFFVLAGLGRRKAAHDQPGTAARM